MEQTTGLGPNNDRIPKLKAMLRALQILNIDFENGTAVGGGCNHRNPLRDSVDRLENIFHVILPFELEKVMHEEDLLNHEIRLCLRGLQGVQMGDGHDCYEGDRAFKLVVKRSINELKEPARRCVDLVVAELCGILSEITQKISRYPRLHEHINRLVTAHILERAEYTKNRITEVIDSEMSYINTKHDHFIGLEAAKSVSLENTPAVRVVRKGDISIRQVESEADSTGSCYCILTRDTLSWLRNGDRIILPLDNLVLRDSERELTFELTDTNGLFVFGNVKLVWLSFANQNEYDDWRASFVAVGLLQSAPPQIEGTASAAQSAGEGEELPVMDHSNSPRMQRRIETTYILVDSYLAVARSNIVDIVPKLISFMLIDPVNEYQRCNLLPELYSLSADEPSSLMDE